MSIREHRVKHVTSISRIAQNGSTGGRQRPPTHLVSANIRQQGYQHWEWSSGAEYDPAQSSFQPYPNCVNAPRRTRRTRPGLDTPGRTLPVSLIFTSTSTSSLSHPRRSFKTAHLNHRVVTRHNPKSRPLFNINLTPTNLTRHTERQTSLPLTTPSHHSLSPPPPNPQNSKCTP